MDEWAALGWWASPGAGRSTLPALREEAPFEPTQTLVVIDGTTRKIVDRDEHLAHVTGLPYSRTDAHIDEVLVDEGDAKLL